MGQDNEKGVTNTVSCFCCLGQIYHFTQILSNDPGFSGPAVLQIPRWERFLLATRVYCVDYKQGIHRLDHSSNETGFLVSLQANVKGIKIFYLEDATLIPPVLSLPWTCCRYLLRNAFQVHFTFPVPSHKCLPPGHTVYIHFFSNCWL